MTNGFDCETLLYDMEEKGGEEPVITTLSDEKQRVVSETSEEANKSVIIKDGDNDYSALMDQMEVSHQGSFAKFGDKENGVDNRVLVLFSRASSYDKNVAGPVYVAITKDGATQITSIRGPDVLKSVGRVISTLERGGYSNCELTVKKPTGNIYEDPPAGFKDLLISRKGHVVDDTLVLMPAFAPGIDGKQAANEAIQASIAKTRPSASVPQR